MANLQNHDITTMEKAQVAVIAVPLPSQSHLNRLLQLSVLISSYGIPVHFVGSATHNRQAKVRASGLKSEAMDRIHFHDFPTPDLSQLDKSPPEQLAVGRAYMNFRGPIGALARELSAKARRVIIICDMFVVEAVGDAVSLPNVEYYILNILSALSMFYFLCRVVGKPFDAEGHVNHLPSVDEYLPEQMIQYLKLPEHFKDRAGDIHNTSRLIDGRYIDLIKRQGNCGGDQKQWGVGSNLVAKFSFTDEKIPRHKCLEWLDKQAPRSVIYVSFGNNVSLSDEQVRELAMGLEQSQQKFIWVLRRADKADIFSGDETSTELPEGFEERVQENGMVVRDFAPQLEILAHKSVGGFISHCGWNSCLESLTMGVPTAAWPNHIDQPLNAIYLAEILKVGLIVKEWTKRKELVKASVIKNAIERLMASEEGEEIRKRAEELSIAIKNSMEEGGESRKELDSFIAHITR